MVVLSLTVTSEGKTEENNMDVYQIWSSLSRWQIDSLWWWTGRVPVCPAHGCVAGSLTSDTQCPPKSNRLQWWKIKAIRPTKMHECAQHAELSFNWEISTMTEKKAKFYVKEEKKLYMNTNLQLSKSSIHSCSSIGYLVRSISQATVEVILGTKEHFLKVLSILSWWKCLNFHCLNLNLNVPAVSWEASWLMYKQPVLSVNIELNWIQPIYHLPQLPCISATHRIHKANTQGFSIACLQSEPCDNQITWKYDVAQYMKCKKRSVEKLRFSGRSHSSVIKKKKQIPHFVFGTKHYRSSSKWKHMFWYLTLTNRHWNNTIIKQTLWSP